MQKGVKCIAAGTEFVRDGEPYDHTYIVKDGWAIRFKTLSDGRRQILNFVLPGDFIGLFSALFAVADHSLAPLSDLEVHPTDTVALLTLFGTCPRLGAAFAPAAGRHAPLLAEPLSRIGRRSPLERTGPTTDPSIPPTPPAVWRG